MLDMLRLLWKFKLDAIIAGAVNHIEKAPSFTHIIITYSKTSPEFEHWCIQVKNIYQVQKVLLFDIAPKEFACEFKEVFGAYGVRSLDSRSSIDVTPVDGDPIILFIEKGSRFNQAPGEQAGSFLPAGAKTILCDESGNPLLIRYGSYYSCGIPIWQLGVPSFPPMLTVLRNFLFFMDGKGHFSPFPYASLRIDDLPLSSEQYLRAGGVSDYDRREDIALLCAWSKEHNGSLEFMVNSHVMDRNGELCPLGRVVPKSAKELLSHYRDGTININAHGRSHIDEQAFVSHGNVSPMEFADLDEDETVQHLSDCRQFIKRFFGKTAAGFVPPCWGYRAHLTKEICSRYFSFVIDSAQNYRSGEDVRGLGYVDNDNLLHITETWHLGSAAFDFEDAVLWRTFLDGGIPVHMMAHSPFLAEPLPGGLFAKLLTAISLLLLLPVGVFIAPVSTIRQIGCLFSPVKWNRLGFLRRLLTRFPVARGTCVRHLLAMGNSMGATWVFTERLAGCLREYNGLEVVDYERTPDGRHEIVFRMQADSSEPVLFHLPGEVAKARIDGMPLSPRGRSIDLPPLKAGIHNLTATLV